MSARHKFMRALFCLKKIIMPFLIFENRGVTLWYQSSALDHQRESVSLSCQSKVSQNIARVVLVIATSFCRVVGYVVGCLS